MTRKDYELIAGCLRDEIAVSEANHEIVSPVALKECARALARDLGNDNNRFDSLRFLRACGLSDEEIGQQA